MLNQLLFYLKASRPGLWFQTIWLYLLPTTQNYDIFSHPVFWIGLIFVCLPLNLFVYGINDIADYEIDQNNIRKDSFLFGAKGTKKQLNTLPIAILATQIPFWIYFVLHTSSPILMLSLLIGMIILNIIYNLPKIGLRTNPPLELLNQFGYLLILPFCTLLNDIPGIPNLAILYLVLFCTHSHLLGEIMDFYPDRASGRRTVSTVIGIKNTKIIVTILLLLESLLLLFAFQDFVLAGLLFTGVIWLLLDTFIIYRERQYTKQEFTLFGIALNGIGFSSMLWVWHNGSLQVTNFLF